MNGPLRVFRTRRFVSHDTEVSLPDCMYKLKNIHKERNGMVVERSADHVSSAGKKLDIFDQNNQDIPEMAMLETRQQQILAQLAELKKQMLSIKLKLNVTQDHHPQPASSVASVTSSSVCTTDLRPVNDLTDIVLHCSPLYPPYSIEVLQKLWKDKIKIAVETFQHSSITSMPLQALAFIESVESFKSVSSPVLKVRIIWKDVGPRTQFMVSHPTFVGEVNLLRYLARISHSSLSYENMPNPHEIDSLLDVCYRIIISKTKTERASLMQTLHKSLGKAQWLAGRTDISIADVAAFSTLKQLDKTEINVGLGKLVERVSSHPPLRV